MTERQRNPTPPSKQTCQAKKADGTACGAGVKAGQRYCFQHDPERAAEAAEARKLGGQARQRPAPAPAVDLSTVEAQRRAIEQTIDRVRSGAEPLNTGRFVIYAISVARGLLDDDIDRRLAELESVLKT